MRFLLVTFLFLSSSPTILATTFRICYESTHFFPFNESGNKDQVLSPVIKAINVASHKAQLETEFIRASWTRCLEDVANNRVDAVLTSLWSKEREKFLVFPKDKNGNLDPNLHLIKAKYKIYVHKDSQLTWDGQTISNIQAGIGAPESYIAKEKLKKMKVLKETNLKVKQAFDLIVKNRLDGYVVLENVGNIILNNYPDRKLIKVLNKDFITDNLYIPVSFEFSKNYPNKTQLFFKELAISRDKYMAEML